MVDQSNQNRITGPSSTYGVTPYQVTHDLKYSYKSFDEQKPRPEVRLYQTDTPANSENSSNENESQGEILAQASRHERGGHTRTGARVFNCPYCGREFTCNRDLEVHMRTHTGEKPYKCNVCDRRFSQNSNMKKHLRTHTGEKPYKCKECGRGFSQKGHLNVHLRTHTLQM